MDEDEGDRALRQQPDLTGDLGGRLDAGAGKKLGKMRLEHRLVTACDQSSRMAGQVGELDDQAREARARPAWPVGPHSELAEQAIYDGLGRTRQPIAEGLERGQRQLMLRLEHVGQQLVLALEVVVERALGDARRGRDLVHADAAVTLATEQPVGGVEDALAGIG
jgi:hypothetical protein